MSRSEKVTEILILLALAGILGNIAIPVVHDVSLAGSANAILEEVADIREMSRAYEKREGRFPAHGAWGRTPVELEHDGKRLDFKGRHAELRWRNWGLLGGLEEPLRAVHVRSDHPELLKAVMSGYDGRVIMLRNDQLALVVD